MSVHRLLIPVLFNLEDRKFWVSGRFRQDPSLFIEFSFQDSDQLPARYWIDPQAPITYLGVHDRKRTVAEFSLGQWPKPILDHELKVRIAHVVLPLRGYRPYAQPPAQAIPSYLLATGTSSYAL